MSARFLIRIGYQLTDFEEAIQGKHIEFNYSTRKLKTRLRDMPWSEKEMKEISLDMFESMNEDFFVPLLRSLQENIK